MTICNTFSKFSFLTLLCCILKRWAAQLLQICPLYLYQCLYQNVRWQLTVGCELLCYWSPTSIFDLIKSFLHLNHNLTSKLKKINITIIKVLVRGPISCSGVWSFYRSWNWIHPRVTWWNQAYNNSVGFFFQSFFQTCGLTVGVSNQTETISAVAVVRSHSVGAVMHAGSQEEGAFIHICRGRDQRDSETGTLMEPCSLVCLLTVRKQGVLVFPSAMQRVLGLIRPPIESSHYVCTWHHFRCQQLNWNDWDLRVSFVL